ncbi:MAG TPA: exonuclease domain-containing protein [Thiopseudomonas sp.]|nr:exonuclease domain-containing protein [Thiopseudomonas sp.]
MISKNNHLEHTTFAFLDIETTGGNSSHDRITEIGIRFWHAGEAVGEWQTLLNPGLRISPFIEQLTGISNAMVADAPSFASIADTLEEQLRDTVFVAHNARFDYGFIKSEYRRLGRLFSARVLCTVKLSRHLHPEFRRHNMDALIERHGLAQVQRHRAMGDVSAMLEFFTHALAEKGVAKMEEAIAALLQSPSIPSHLPLDTLRDLPRGPGVYRFYGENDVLLYVGKSINITQRVASHFSGDHNTSRGLRISESLRRVEYTETAGELGALLLELRQIKTLNPLFNRRSRAAKNLVSIELAPNDCGYLQARLVREIEPHRLASYFGLFRSKRDAEQGLSDIAAKNDLCNRLLGLEPVGDGPCFQRALGRCKGACEGIEDVTLYNLRVQIAFHQLRLRTWPWKGPVAIVEYRGDGAQSDILVVYNWVHVTTVHDEQELYDLSLRGQSVTFDLDSYKLLVKALMGSADKGHSLIELPAVAAPDVLMP